MEQQAVPQSQFGKTHELLYELKVQEVMTRSLLTVRPEDSMQTVKELLRTRRISGAPVLDNGQLVGIVSVEDVIKALEKGMIGASVAECMSTQVVSVRDSDIVAEALKTFARHKYGRLPVLDEAGRLVGILTPLDITVHVLRVLDTQYRKSENVRPARAKGLSELTSLGGRLAFEYPIGAGDFTRAGEASSRIKRALVALGLPPPLVRRCAIAAYEQEMNLIIHTQGGSLAMEVSAEQIRLAAEDTGPGIPDVDQAMQPGFSTAPDWVREMGFGAGMGLNNIRKCSDRFVISSEVGKGTLVEAIIQLGECPDSSGR